MNIKTDLATSIALAVVGILIAYFVTNIFIGPIDDYQYTTVDSSIGIDLDEPDANVFNYRALNPTVEVYIGDCTEFSEDGECIEGDSSSEPSETPEPESSEPTPEDGDNSSSETPTEPNTPEEPEESE